MAPKMVQWGIRRARGAALKPKSSPNSARFSLTPSAYLLSREAIPSRRMSLMSSAPKDRSSRAMLSSWTALSESALRLILTSESFRIDDVQIRHFATVGLLRMATPATVVR
jgi:hypothetical protein